MEEAKKYTKVVEVVSAKEAKAKKYTNVAPSKTWKIDKEGGYLYYCDNETIAGLEFPRPPKT